MARTTFSGPVKSDNGFEGDVAGTSVTATSLNIGASTTITAAAFSGTIGTTQQGFLPIKVNGTTKYIALYNSATP